MRKYKRVDKRKDLVHTHVEIDKEFEDMFQIEDAADGDESLSVQPWKGAIVEPARHPQPVKTDPKQTYEIEFVYGVESTDSRKHLGFNANGQLVYMAAAIGIVLDYTQTPMQQKFFGGGELEKKPKGQSVVDLTSHNDDISALKMSND